MRKQSRAAPPNAPPEARSREPDRSLLAAVHDEAVRQIVRRNRHADAVAGQHADVVASHTARKLSAHHCAALVHLDGVLAAAESVLNDALHLEKITFAHTLVLLVSAG